MLDLTVITDAPDATSLAAGEASWIQIAKVGSYSDPRYGKFSITPKDFSKWIANFNSLNKVDGRLGLPIDVDHRPETQGNTEAAGWLTDLQIRAGGTELWAKAEWNDLGTELVRNRRYAYISPSYVANYKDETGKEHGTALLGVALTNRPFLSMATVSLSRHVQTSTETYTPTEMPYPKSLLDALKLSEDADEATVLAKIVELTATPEPQNKTLADLAKAEGAIVLSASDFASLAKDAADGKAAATSLKEMRFENAFTAALNDSKGARVLPAQKDNYKKLFDVDADTCISLIESLPNLVNAQPVGSGAGKDDTAQLSAEHDPEVFATDDDSVKLDNTAQQLMAADSSLTYGDAVARAMVQLGMN
jgi:phage I-like protein